MFLELWMSKMEKDTERKHTRSRPHPGNPQSTFITVLKYHSQLVSSSTTSDYAQ